MSLYLGTDKIGDVHINPTITQGTDTSDATLSSNAQLPSGVTAYADGVKYIGTQPVDPTVIVHNGTVTIPNGLYTELQSVTVSTESGGQAALGTTTITENGVYAAASDNLDGYSIVTVTVPTGGGTPTLQSKTATPSESAQTITADTGYDGLSSVEVSAVSSSYVGSGIARKSSMDLTASGSTITAPAGYYAEVATKSVASGSAGTPTASKGTVNNNAITVTPSVTNTTGYITGSTINGTEVSVSASELVSGTLNVDDDGTYDVTNYASAEVAIDYVTKTVPLTIVNHSESFARIVQYGFSSNIVNASGYIAVGSSIALTPNSETVVRVSAGGCAIQLGTGAAGGNFEVRINETVKSPYLEGQRKDSTARVKLYKFSSSEVPVTGATIDLYDIEDPWPENVLLEDLSATSNGTYTAPSGTAYSSVTVSVSSSAPTLQSKTATPTESQQTITADTGYDGLSSVEVGAISSTYVGSAIDARSSTDLTVSGATITAPAGYYAVAASKSVASGSAATPATTITANPTISVSAAGLITASVSQSQNITPTISAGYISTGTSGTISVSGSASSQLTTRTSADLSVSGATVTAPSGYYASAAAATISSGSVTAPTTISSTGASVTTGTNTVTFTKTISVTPNVTAAGYISSGTAGNASVSLTATISTLSSTNLTASGSTVTAPAGYYAAAASKTVSAGTAGTPSATKGSVSNHSISVTPSVTNTTGWITGSTKTGTAVTVSASELVSGSSTYTSNGTYDVTTLASAIVAVPIVTYYTGSSAPASSLGSNGDIYLQTS